MPGENPYLYGQPTSNGAPQPPAFYPPPPGYLGAPPTPPRQNRPPARSAFTDIPVGDYIRDAVAGILLFVSFFLPWTTEFGIARGGSGGIIALVVLLTLLSLASLGLPYFARLGMLGQNWQVSQIRVLRLAVNGPFVAMVVVFLFYDVIRGMFRFGETSTIFSGDGIGSAAWFGLAGALLAAQPRAAELRIDPRGGPRWLGWIKPLLMVATGFSVVSGLLSLVYLLVSASRYDYQDGAETLKGLVTILGSAVVPVIVLGMVASGLARRFNPWRLTVAGFGVALLVASFFLSFDDLASVELFHTITINPYYAITFWVAAATIAFLPYGLPASSDSSHPGYVWIEAARNGMRIIAVWSFGTAAMQIIMAATGFGLVSVGEAVALAVFSVLIGVLAVIGTKMLAVRYFQPDPRPSREVVIGISLGLLVLMIGRLVTQSVMYDYGYPSVWTFDLATAAATIFIALAVAVSPAVRDLYSGVPLFASVTAGPSPVAGYGQPAPSQQTYAQPSQQFQQNVAQSEAAADPGTPAATLFEIASNSPELRPAVAANPSTYEDLVAWLGKLGDPAVDAALARRAAGQFGLPREEAAQTEALRNTMAASQVRVQPDLVKVAQFDVPAQQAAQSNPRDAAAADPNTPAATLFEIATNSPELRAAVAANPSTYDDLVAWLGKLGDPAVDAALARRASGHLGFTNAESMSTTVVPAVQASAPTRTREQLAADPNTPAATLFDIASNSPELRPIVAANPTTYDDLLVWLGKLGNSEVDAALAGRRAGQPDSVEPGPMAVEPEVAITQDPQAETEPVETRESPTDIEPEPVSTETTIFPANTASLSTVESTEVTEAAEVDDDARAIADPTCSAAILFRVAEHRPELRSAVAVHPNAYPGLLEWLSGLGDTAVNDALSRRQ